MTSEFKTVVKNKLKWVTEPYKLSSILAIDSFAAWVRYRSKLAAAKPAALQKCLNYQKEVHRQIKVRQIERVFGKMLRRWKETWFILFVKEVLVLKIWRKFRKILQGVRATGVMKVIGVQGGLLTMLGGCLGWGLGIMVGGCLGYREE